jgi:hypothetical protein
MSIQTQASELERGQKVAAQRKPYRTPKLSYLGTVRELTHSANTQTGGDFVTSKKPAGAPL